MAVRSRMLVILIVLVLGFSASGLVIAQSSGPDPNSPVQDRTPTPGTDQKSDHPALGAATPAAGEPTTPSTLDVSAFPAAMTLDSSVIPDDYTLFYEIYFTPEEIADRRAGQIDREQLLSTGLEASYESFYRDSDDNEIRTYIYRFKTIQGVRAGFNLLEDEDTLVPNGGLKDLPALEGVGEPPGEITTGTIENGDGTQTNEYDISYRIDRYEIGIAMNTQGDTEPDTKLADKLAADLADRVKAVLAGESVANVDGALPGYVLQLEGQVAIEGFESGVETFQLNDPADVPDGFVAGYFRGASYSTFIQEILPFASITAVRFESADDVANALDSPESIMPNAPDLDDLRGVEIDGVDDLTAFQFTASNDADSPDSVRLFMQIDDLMLVIDVEGMPTLDDAETAAIDLANATIDCVNGGDCADPDVISGK